MTASPLRQEWNDYLAGLLLRPDADDLIDRAKADMRGLVRRKRGSTEAEWGAVPHPPKLDQQ